MNALEKARTAYASSAAPIRSARSTEYELFAQITARLKSASGSDAPEPAQGPDDGRSFAALAAALHDNRRLWTALAADLAEPGNALPDDLRARLFYLAEFSLQHSPKVLGGSASADVLVEINTAVMRGLRQAEAA